LVKSPESSTFTKRFLTARLFPKESTSAPYEALRATFLCATGAGAKALAAEQATAVILTQWRQNDRKMSEQAKYQGKTNHHARES
jgi:hypothetical protein